MILNYEVTIKKMPLEKFIDITNGLWSLCYSDTKSTNRLQIVDVISVLYKANLEHLSHLDKLELQHCLKMILNIIINNKHNKKTVYKLFVSTYQKHRHWLFDGYINRFGRVINKPTRFGFNQ